MKKRNCVLIEYQKTATQECIVTNKRCNDYKILHMGKCGDCQKTNICPPRDNGVKEKRNMGKRKGKGGRKRERKEEKEICASDGESYDNKCNFYIARCSKFAEDETILERKRKNLFFLTVDVHLKYIMLSYILHF